jgi:SAM-dependent methyltransferase
MKISLATRRTTMKPFRKIASFFRLLGFLRDHYGPVLAMRRITNLDEHLAPYSASRQQLVDSVAVDLGCGDIPRNPFGASKLLGVDIQENMPAGVHRADIVNEPLPFHDDSFDYITAFDFIEHIPRVAASRNPFVEVMNEVWRTLKPGGIFLSHTPCVPFPHVFQDPTHVNFITVETFPKYFGNQFDWGRMYGFKGAFEILDQSILEPCWLVSVLRKP